MFIRDFINLMRSRKDALGSRMEGQATDGTTATRDSQDRGRRQDFMPVVIPPVAVGPDLWAQEGFGSGSFINGYLEDGTRTHHASLAGLGAGGGVLHFVEGKDGFHYGVFADGAGKYKLFKKFKVGKSAITSVTTLATLAGEIDYFPDHNPVMVAPNGRIYLRVRDVPDFASYPAGFDQPYGKEILEWDGSSLTSIGAIPMAYSNYMHFFHDASCMSDCGGGTNAFRYSTVENTLTIYRRLVPVILKNGRWVAADLLPGDSTTAKLGLEGTVAPVSCKREAGECDPCSILCNPYGTGSPCFPLWGGAEFTSVPIRVTGNAWWEKADAASAWANVANGGVATHTKSYSMPWSSTFVVYTLEVVHTQTGTDSFIQARKAQRGGTDYLPTMAFDQALGLCNTVSDPATPWQGDSIMEADDQHIYYILAGGTDFFGSFQAGGFYRAVIPAAGGTPSWASLGVSQPPGSLFGLTLTKNRLWSAHAEAGTDNGIRHYKKDGSDPKFIAVPSGVFSITGGWRHRWKH